MNRSLPCRLLLMLALLATCATADARNTRYLFPVKEAIRSASARQIIGKDIGFHFGDALPQGLVAAPETSDEVYVKAVANPSRSRSAKYLEEDSDRQTCRDALRMALADLAQRARDKGGNAVVHIVSFYNRVEMSSSTEYECHAGMTRSVVELKGQIARIDPARAAAPALKDERLVDTSLLPNRSEKMVARYQHFLTLRSPRAFAISESGRWWMAWGKVAGDSAAPAERALRDCEKNHGERCVLYAIDQTVVYTPPIPASPTSGPARPTTTVQ